MKLVKIKTPKADIARYYKRNLMVSIIATLILMILVFRVQFNPESEIQLEETEQEVIEMEEIIQTDQVETPPPPERPRDPEIVPDDEIVEDEVFDFEADPDDGAQDLPPPPPPEEEEEDEEPEIFESVEDMPQIRGGMDALYDALEYPDLAQRAGVEGRVVVQFVITEEGEVRDPQVVRSAGAGLDEAAIDAIKTLEFEPGRQRGRAVSVLYTIPVNFRLDDVD